jgi:hypothetical protein
MIHGDAWRGNLLRDGKRVVLADWDTVSIGWRIHARLVRGSAPRRDWPSMPVSASPFCGPRTGSSMPRPQWPLSLAQQVQAGVVRVDLDVAGGEQHSRVAQEHVSGPAVVRGGVEPPTFRFPCQHARLLCRPAFSQLTDERSRLKRNL